MKKIMALVVTSSLLIIGLCACGSTPSGNPVGTINPQNTQASSETEKNTPEASAPIGAGTEINVNTNNEGICISPGKGVDVSEYQDENGAAWFLLGNSGYSCSYDEYDYAVLLDMSLSENGNNELVADPVVYVDEAETERWEETGPHEEGPSYDVINKKEESVRFKLAEDAEFHYYCFGDEQEQEMYTAADRTKNGEAVTKDLSLFLKTHEQLIDQYPYLLILNDAGEVTYLIQPVIN